MSLAVKPVYSKRTFLTAAYVVDLNGQFRPKRPCRCPTSGDGSDSCHLRVSKWRERKFGPGYALLIFRCFVHRSVFAIYPPDWTPYARRPLVALSPDGRDGVHEEGIATAWASTVFQAVVDGASDRAWPCEARFSVDERGLVPAGVFRTQCRHIRGALVFFAISDDCDGRDQEKVAAALGLDLALLHAAKNRARDGPWWKGAAKAAEAVLSTLGVPGRRILCKLIGIGHSRRYWGPTS